MPNSQHDTLRGVVLEVYRTGLVPPVRKLAASWRAVPERPARIVGAVVRTVTTPVTVALYLLLATLVPATVVFLLVITSPVLLWVGVSNVLDGSWPKRA